MEEKTIIETEEIKDVKLDNKIDITNFKNILEKSHINNSKIDWHGKTIEIKHSLTFSEVITFAESVSKSCFTIDSHDYLPEVKDFAIKNCILSMYTNLNMSDSLIDTDYKYDFIYNTDIIDIVLSHIDTKQLTNIISAVDSKIDNIIDADTEHLRSQINELYSILDNLSTQLEGMFAGVKTEDISQLISNFANSNINEEKLVKAIINQKK